MMYAIASQSDEKFVGGGLLPAHVRARGNISIVAKQRDGETVRQDVREEGALRIRFPREASAGLSAVLVNTAGGMTGGDAFSIAAVVQAGGRLTLTTAAAEKYYRSLGDTADVQVTLRAGGGAALAWLPQESIIFDGARVRRSYTIDLSDHSSILLCDITGLGRAAMGEWVRDVVLKDRWHIRRNGALLFADYTNIDGCAPDILAGSAVAGGATSFATMVHAGENSERVCSNWRKLAAEYPSSLRAGIGMVNGICVARFVARELAVLRGVVADNIASVESFGLPRSWLT